MSAVDSSRLAEDIMAFLKPKLGAKLRMWLNICGNCGVCTDTCHHYHLNSGQHIDQAPSRKVKFLLEIAKRKGRVDEEFLDRMYQTVYKECNMCRRCTMYCPHGIDVAQIIALSRALLTHLDRAPEALKNAIQNYKEFGNQMGITKEDWVDTIEWCEEETEDEVKGLKIPLDKKDCRIMYTLNAREPKFYPQDINEASMIFHVAGESWTFPVDDGWDSTNLSMFCGDVKTSRMIVDNIFKRADELGAQYVAITECGHAYRAVKYEAPGWLGRTPKQPVLHSVELFRDYLRDGKVKLKKKMDVPVTFQEPCNLVRNGGLQTAIRELAELCADDVRPMSYEGNYNYCCSGGGGSIPMGPEMKKKRMDSGKIKADQIRETGAKVVFVPCHNCIDQIRDLNKEYDLGITAMHFKEFIAHNMVIPPHMQHEEE